MTKTKIKKAQQRLEKWKESHAYINSLRKEYQKKVLDWVVKSMEFEKEPVDMDRLKELFLKEKTAPVR